MKKPTLICIHHSAVSHDKNADQFVANNNYHKAKWNFKSSLGFYLGYNYEIAKNGKITQARRDGEPTAAAYQSWALYGVVPRWTGNMNDGRAIHICLDGNFDIEKPAPEQIYALRDLLKRLTKLYSIPKGNIYFHRNFASKTCPGKALDLNWIRNLIG
jgi:N-acetylmuramoyl-L-alanine amidase